MQVSYLFIHVMLILYIYIYIYTDTHTPTYLYTDGQRDAAHVCGTSTATKPGRGQVHGACVKTKGAPLIRIAAFPRLGHFECVCVCFFFFGWGVGFLTFKLGGRALHLCYVQVHCFSWVCSCKVARPSWVRACLKKTRLGLGSCVVKGSV